VSALGDIASRAAEKNLPFLLMGGHAVIAHGYHRNTFDLDLIIPRRDRDKWMELAGSLGYKFSFEGPTFLQFDPPKPDSYGLDLMLANESTFNKLFANAVPAPSSEPNTRMVSLHDLLALKCHTIKYGHKGRIVKDSEDVIQLVKANRLNLDDARVQRVFLEFGTTELYEKVKRACRDE